MKTRLGFVSNSSSSSFILGVKGVPFSASTISTCLGVQEHSPLWPFAKQVSEWCVANLKATDIDNLIRYYGCVEDAPAAIRDAIAQGYTVYTGYASSDESGVEQVLCEMDLHYKSDTILLEKDGGY